MDRKKYDSGSMIGGGIRDRGRFAADRQVTRAKTDYERGPCAFHTWPDGRIFLVALKTSNEENVGRSEPEEEARARGRERREGGREGAVVRGFVSN